MNRPLCLQRVVLFGGLLFLAASAGAQDNALEMIMPGLRERAVVLNIIARIVEQGQEEIWNSVNSKITIPGRPVSLKLIGENIVIYVQFTPYLKENGGNVLVAQGQIWVNVPNQGIRYQTTIQTIPMEYGEQIYFFPLGKANSENQALIEIQLELNPYTEGAGAPGNSAISGGPIRSDTAIKGNDIPQ